MGCSFLSTHFQLFVISVKVYYGLICPHNFQSSSGSYQSALVNSKLAFRVFLPVRGGGTQMVTNGIFTPVPWRLLVTYHCFRVFLHSS
uniref:Uncharacterized protein n=1 Tax=Anguilla anguilla TaxID=7936 RepID=A0A0E9QHS5_ANGAN